MSRAVCVLAALALFVGGCSASPGPAPLVQDDEAGLAAGALESGNYAGAADLYRRALAKAPDRLPLHYGLAVSASFLDLKPEAIREVRWVLEHGDHAQPEVESARNWLVKVGALAAPSKRQTATLPTTTATDEPAAASSASVEGRVVPVGGPQAGPAKRLQLFLIEQPSRAHHYPVRTDEEGRFRFPSVAPGIYKLSDRITGPPTWRLRVEAKPGQIVFLDLGPDNSTKSRDDFPGHP
jgi:hypothetical protein